MTKLIKTALVDSIATSAYITLIGTLMYLSATIKLGQNNSFLVPIALLSLFVLSAAITGFLIFGRPVLMYLDGHKKEAVSLLGYTLVFFAVTTALTFGALFLFTR